MKDMTFTILLSLFLLSIVLFCINFVININNTSYQEPISSCVTTFLRFPQSLIGLGCIPMHITCAIFDGTIEWTDGHPGPYAFYDCYKKAPDTGKECAGPADCMSGVCDLSVALDKCELITDEPFDVEEQTYLGFYDNYNLSQVFFKRVYECSNTNPGICEDSPRGGRNPGGLDYGLQMNGTQLIEIQVPGSIS